LNVGEGVHGDSRVVGVDWRCVVIIYVEHLEGEELFAQLRFVPIGEELIAMETFVVPAALRDLH
jgi:hypothetical protein